MAHTLSAREAFELHKSAVTRDFIAKPRLGKRNILTSEEEEKHK
jgi:V-type H+-transporting ATPase subunit B